MAIRVDRFPNSTGRSRQTYTGTIVDVSLYEVTIRFTSAGPKRKSGFDVCIETSSFKDVARAMMGVESGAAVQAFGAALAEYRG
jgi:hypothetical protein